MFTMLFLLVAAGRVPENPCKEVFINEYFECIKDLHDENICETYATEETMACVLDDNDID